MTDLGAENALALSSPDRRRSPSASLRARLTIAFIVGGLIVALVAGSSALAIVHLIDARHALVGDVDPASLNADQLELNYVNQETGIRGYILTNGNSSFLQPYQAALDGQGSLIRQLEENLADQPRLLGLVRQAEREGAIWQSQYARPALASIGSHSATYTAPSSLDGGKRLFDLVRARFSSLDVALNASRASAGNTLKSAITILIIALSIGLGLVVLSGIILRRSLRLWVTDPLLHLGADARRVAGGELGHPIAPTGPPEVSRLAIDVESMRQRMVDDLEEVARARADLDLRNVDLARSNVELEQFAYVASHDLQEPLRKVTSFVQLLQQRYGGQFDERADQYIEFAVDGAKRMQALINDLLVFSRVGRTTAGFIEVDLNHQVAVAVSNLEAAIEEAGARVEIASLPVVAGDAELLTALWQNLIGNAIKFRGSDDPVVRIDAVPHSSDWLFTVTDNGIGIEPRFADKVFVIFQRLHSREAFSGTGIGLALCKKIVEFHGGAIWLDTEARSGTQMRLTLPQTHDGDTA